jgi:hypothetical protein
MIVYYIFRVSGKLPGLSVPFFRYENRVQKAYMQILKKSSLLYKFVGHTGGCAEVVQIAFLYCYTF